MMTDRPQAMAPYKRIAAQIRARIESGEIRPGDRVPSVREIMRDEGVSTATATRVAAVLRAEGYVESVPGIGTLASLPKKITAGSDRLRMLRANGSGYRLVEDRAGRRVVRRRDIVAIRPVPEDIASVLGTEGGLPALIMTNIYWDQHDEVTEYTVDFLGPGRELSADYALE